MRTTKPHVKQWKWGSEKTKWVVDGLRDVHGNRKRKFFRTRDEANDWLAQRRPELKNQGRAALGMSDSQRIDAVRALAILEPYGASLTKAAEEFAERAQVLSRTVTFAKLREEFVNAKVADRKSSRYVSDLRHRLERVGKEFDSRAVATLESWEFDDWLRSLALAPLSRVNFRKVLRTTFEYALSRGYARTNPIIRTAEVRVDNSSPGILRPREIAALLAAADPQVLPALAISAFAGLRDAEVGRISWECIDLVGGHLKVDATVAKTSSRRVVPISDNLRAWLTPHARKSGPLRPSPRIAYPLCRAARIAAVSKLKQTGEAAPNLSVWPHNALRHSYASYRMAVVSNATLVAEECGHSVQVMKSNYRELVTRAEGEEWFGVLPEARNSVPCQAIVKQSLV